jgi:DNA-binding NarL/FixJ family response regulator
VLHLEEIDRPSLQQAAELAAQIPGAHLAEIGGGFPPWMWGSYDSALPFIHDFLTGIPAAPREAPGSAQSPDGLSQRETEVIRLVAEGKGNQEIADELVISLNTVRRHVSNIFDKTGAANRAQATAYAKDHGLA